MHEQRDCAVQQTACSVAPCTTEAGLQASSWPGWVSSTIQRQPVPVGLHEIVEPDAPPEPPAPPPPELPPSDPSRLADPLRSPFASQPAITIAKPKTTFATVAIAREYKE
jgi:hypothetical protein